MEPDSLTNSRVKPLLPLLYTCDKQKSCTLMNFHSFWREGTVSGTYLFWSIGQQVVYFPLKSKNISFLTSINWPFQHLSLKVTHHSGMCVCVYIYIYIYFFFINSLTALCYCWVSRERRQRLKLACGDVGSNKRLLLESTAIEREKSRRDREKMISGNRPLHSWIEESLALQFSPR